MWRVIVLAGVGLAVGGCGTPPERQQAWELSGRLLAQRPVPDLLPPGAEGARVPWAVFAPDGERIAWFPVLGELEVWALSRPGEAISLEEPPGEFPDGATWSPDGRKIVVFAIELTVAYAAADLRLVWSAAGARACSWSPDGERIAATSSGLDEGPLTIRRATDGETVATLPPPAAARSDYWKCWWSPDGKRLFVGDLSGQHSPVVNVETLAVEGALPPGLPPHSAAWSPDGRKLLIGSEVSDWWDKRVLIYELGGGNEILDLSDQGDYRTAGVPYVALWSPDGRHVVLTRARELEARSHALQVHEAATGRLVARLIGGEAFIRDAHWSKSRQAVRAVYDNGEVWEWDVSAIE